MKIVIIGAGLTGLYLGYLLKHINIDVDIYEKTSRPGGKINTVRLFNTDIDCGADIIFPQHLNILSLLAKLKIDIKTNKMDIISQQKNYSEFIKCLNKIELQYKKDKTTDISAYIYIKSILSKDEFTIFIDNIFNTFILEMEISDFMKYNFYDLNLINSKISINGRTSILIDKLASYVQDRLYLNHLVQEITYMPITNKYLLQINDSYINADKVIITTNISIKKMRLNIPNQITSQLDNIRSLPWLKIFTLHSDDLRQLLDNKMIQTKLLFTNIYINKNNSKILNLENIIGDNASILYNMIKTEDSLKIKNFIYTFLKKETNLDLPSIIDFGYCYWSNGYNINLKQIKSNFYRSYSLILTGEWVHPYHGTLEGACMSAIDTFNIIKKYEYMDKLSHKPDKIKSLKN